MADFYIYSTAQTQRRTRYPLESCESDFLHSALAVSARTLAHSQAVLEGILLASGAL